MPVSLLSAFSYPSLWERQLLITFDPKVCHLTQSTKMLLRPLPAPGRLRVCRRALNGPREGLAAWRESHSLPGCLPPVAAASRGGGGQPGLECAHLPLSWKMGRGCGRGLNHSSQPHSANAPVLSPSLFFLIYKLVVINGTLRFLVQKQGHGEDTVVLKPR